MPIRVATPGIIGAASRLSRLGLGALAAHDAPPASPSTIERQVSQIVWVTGRAALQAVPLTHSPPSAVCRQTLPHQAHTRPYASPGAMCPESERLWRL